MEIVLIILGVLAAVFLWHSSHRQIDVEDVSSNHFHTKTLVWFIAMLFVITAVFVAFKLAFNVIF